MSTLSITLSPALGRFLKEEKEAENYASTQEAVNAVLKKEMRRKQELAWLKKKIAVGVAQADRGEFVEFSAKDIIREGRKRLLAKGKKK